MGVAFSDGVGAGGSGCFGECVGGGGVAAEVCRCEGDDERCSGFERLEVVRQVGEVGVQADIGRGGPRFGSVRGNVAQLRDDDRFGVGEQLTDGAGVGVDGVVGLVDDVAFWIEDDAEHDVLAWIAFDRSGRVVQHRHVDAERGPFATLC